MNFTLRAHGFLHEAATPAMVKYISIYLCLGDGERGLMKVEIGWVVVLYYIAGLVAI